jgi:hypothetical protein
MKMPMVQKNVTILFITSILIFTAFARVFASSAKFNLSVPVPWCTIVNCSCPFNIETQKEFTVGKEVARLSDFYDFTVTGRYIGFVNKVRIILVMDASPGFCREVTNCPGASRNDPGNKRIKAANQFVDSIVRIYPDCEIGVIVYSDVGFDPTGSGTVIKSLEAATVGDTVILRRIHQTIDAGSCGEVGAGAFGKVIQRGRLDKRTLTFTGLALDSAIKLADAGYDSTINSERHIILVTDGDWQTPATSEIIESYASGFPGRKPPYIHGIFISDSANHVANGFPAQGMMTCDSANLIPVDLSSLQMASERTHGNYFPLTTPHTINLAFDSLFRDIILNSKIIMPGLVGLPSITFTNLSNGEQRLTTFESDAAYSFGRHYRVHVPAFDLEFGRNTFTITWTVMGLNQRMITKVDTIIVNRQTTEGTGTTILFREVCGTDSVAMSITGNPGILQPNEFDTMRAAIDPGDTPIFNPNNIAVRAFTPFPDENDGRVLFLFHLNDKNLVNSALAGQPGNGTGSPAISTGGVFGSCISAGTFTTPVFLPLSGNFTFECWIKPGSSGQNASIAGATGFTFGMKNGYLSVTLGSTTITTTHVIERDVWQHTAVARMNGETNIYINGIPMAQRTNTAEAVSGAFTIGNFSGGLLDEVRLSDSARTSTVFNRIVLQIPLAENLTWNINSAIITGAAAVLSPGMWRGISSGRLSFQFTRPSAGAVIVNFFDTLTSGQLMWSKNGDPVNFSMTGIHDKAAALQMNAFRDPAVKVFNLQGRLVKAMTRDKLVKRNLNGMGVCIIKYMNGKIEGRMMAVR